MNRYPAFSIFLFVGLSMAAAVIFSKIQTSDLEAKIEGQESFAHAGSFSVQAKNVVREIANASEVGTEDIANCQCVPKGRRLSPYLVHEKETCSKLASVYQDEFEKMPPLFRERRASTAAEFPRICMVRILNTHQNVQFNEKKCASHVPLCVTEEYVNVVYNLYADVFNCFSLPQKEILPWFLVNGGFHLNASNGVSGLHVSAADSEVFLQRAIAQMQESSETSCQRLLPFAKKLKVNHNNECLQISPPENPLLSFLIFAEKYLETKSMITLGLKQSAQTVAKDEQERLLQILTLQSLHQNPKEILALYSQYLRAPAQENYFDFVSQQNQHLLEKMKQAAKNMNQDFKEGTCVSDL